VQHHLDVIALLQHLPPPQRQALLAQTREWHAPAGAVLFDVDDACHTLALTSSGTVRVVKPVASGHDILLYRLQPGEPCVMSTACLLGSAPYPVRGIADTDVRGLALPAAAVRDLMAACAPFREALFGTLAERLAGLMGLIDELVTRRLDRRLAALLLTRGPIVHATHQQLADELASAREVVSRLLESFELRGCVRLRRARIEISDRAALASLAQAAPDAPQRVPAASVN
jgi:CRP/FNR family transcriptional regulator